MMSPENWARSIVIFLCQTEISGPSATTRYNANRQPPKGKGTLTSSCNLVEPLEQRQFLSAGDLDTTFATGGEFKFGFGSHAVFHDVAVQSDGKIVAVGAVDP